MGCFDKGPTSTTQTVTPPKEYLDAYKDVLARAKGVAATPYQAYGGQGVAPLNATQQAGISGAQSLPGSAQSYIDQAMQLISGSAGPIAGQFGGLSQAQLGQAGQQGFDWLNQSVQDVDVPEFSAENINRYMDPYLNDVIGQSLDWMSHSDQVDQNALRGNAVSAGAWGGDRAGIAQAELGRNQADARNKTIAGLKSQGYAQALDQLNKQQQLALQKGDMAAARKAQAASAALSSFFQGTGMNLQAMQSDAARAGQAGQSIGQLGNMRFGQDLAGIEEMLKAGGLEQTNAQALNDYLRGQFEAGQEYPFKTTGWLADIAGGLGGKAGSTTTNQAAGGSGLSSIFGGLTSLFGIGNESGLFDNMFGGSGATSGPGNVGSGNPFPGMRHGGRVGYDMGGSLWDGPDPLGLMDDSVLQAPPQPQQQGGGGGDFLGTVMKLLPMVLALRRGGRVGYAPGGGVDFWSGPSPSVADVQPKKKKDEGFLDNLLGGDLSGLVGGIPGLLSGQGAGAGLLGIGPMFGIGNLATGLLGGLLSGKMRRGGRVGYDDGGGLTDPWASEDVARTARALDRAAARRRALEPDSLPATPRRRQLASPRPEPGASDLSDWADLPRIPGQVFDAATDFAQNTAGRVLGPLFSELFFPDAGPGGRERDFSDVDVRIHHNALNNERWRRKLARPVGRGSVADVRWPHGNIPMEEEPGFINRDGISSLYADGGEVDDPDQDYAEPDSDYDDPNVDMPGMIPGPTRAPSSIGEVAPRRGKADWWSHLASSPNLALILGGLNTMAGRSPHALQNIGAGFSSGLTQAGQIKQQMDRQAYADRVAQARLEAARSQADQYADVARHRLVGEAERARHNRSIETAADRRAREAAARSDRQQQHWDAVEGRYDTMDNQRALGEAGAAVDRLSMAMSNLSYDPNATPELKASTAKAYSNAVTRLNALQNAVHAPALRPPAAGPAAAPAVRQPTQVPNPTRPGAAPARQAVPVKTPDGRTVDYYDLHPGDTYIDPTGRPRKKKQQPVAAVP